MPNKQTAEKVQPTPPTQPMGETRAIARTQLYRSASNPRTRFDDAPLKELAESIQARGIIVPLLVRPSDTAGTPLEPCFEIVMGERRHRAAEQIGLESLPCTVRPMTDEEVVEVQMVEHLQTQGLHPMEEARGFKKLAETCRLDLDAIARKTAKPRDYILRRMKLCDLVPDAEKLFLDGKLSVETALLVARIPVKLQPKAAKEISGVEDKYDPSPMGVRQARQHVENNYMLRLHEAPFDVKAEHLVSAAGACTDCPKRTGFNRDLFGDVPKSDDRCTDPPCFHDKKKQHVIGLKLQAKECGRVVMDDAEAKKVFKYGYLDHEKYVDLDSTCFADPKHRPLRQVLGKKIIPAEVMLAVDKDGKAHDLLTKDRMAAALAEAGVKVPKEKQGRSQEDAEKERAQMQEERALNHEVELEFQEAVGKAAVKMKPVEFLRFVALTLFEVEDYNIERAIEFDAVRRYPKLVVENDADAALTALGEDVPKMSLPDVTALIAEMLADPDNKDDAKLFKVDMGNLRKRVKAERKKRLAAEAKEKSKAGEPKPGDDAEKL